MSHGVLETPTIAALAAQLDLTAGQIAQFAESYSTDGGTSTPSKTCGMVGGGQLAES